MAAGNAILVDPRYDDPAPTTRGPAPRQANDGARRLRRCATFSAREEAAYLLLVEVRLTAASALSTIVPYLPGDGTTVPRQCIQADSSTRRLLQEGSRHVCQVALSRPCRHRSRVWVDRHRWRPAGGASRLDADRHSFHVP